MAAYAAVLSLYHTLNNIEIHPRPPISLDQSQVDSLTQNITFFQHFLECHNQEDDDLESRITTAAYAAEDVIETHIVDQVHHARSTSNHWGEHISSVDLYGGLERVIQDMDLIKREVMEINIMGTQHQPHLHSNSSVSPASGSTPVFDDALVIEVLDKLTGQQSSLQIIPIVGMGGIGKTTFARYIYSNSLIVHHFDILVWVTISQEYNVSEILDQVLNPGNRDRKNESSENELGGRIHKMFSGRRYLIVMDDMWDNDAFYEVRCYFPDNNNGSRIMITTRLLNLAFELSGSHVFRMKFLDEDKSWGLFCETVFDKELGCPVELENIGKEIARKCRGLPLSILVVGGLLKSSNMTRDYWIYTLENLNSIINLENDEYVSRIMSTSYKELPMYLKPCFLYMGVFPEDREIELSRLVKFWVAEGILKPIADKSLEEVAEEYLKELTERNLILISELRWDGNAELCKMHDLLRDVCLREAQKQKFFGVVGRQKYHLPEGIDMERRIFYDPEYDGYTPECLHAVESAPLARSYLYRGQAPPPLRFKLLRIYSPIDVYSLSFTDYDAIFEQANLRYLTFSYDREPFRFHSFYSLFWSLQTLDVSYSYHIKLTLEIWDMPLLRHVTIERMFLLPDPPNGEHNLVLEYLQTLSCVMNFKCSEEMVKRTPNLKELKVRYDMRELDADEVMPNVCLNNLDRLQKLESLFLYISDNCDVKNIMRNSVSFPHSLKKLILMGTRLNWEELTMWIGSLPLLQYLRLHENACVGDTWETDEGQFCSLRYLEISFCNELKYWETDSSHFPRLEILCLVWLENLEEIPPSTGDIPTLKSIRLEHYSKSVYVSAKRIIEKQKEDGNEDLELQVEGRKLNEVDYEEVDEEEGDQVVSDPLADYEEDDEEEGDQVISDPLADYEEDDEEEGDQVVSDPLADYEEDDKEEGDQVVSDS